MTRPVAAAWGAAGIVVAAGLAPLLVPGSSPPMSLGILGLILFLVRAWSEALWVVVSESHPVADRPVAVLADLDHTALRLPSREVDPPLHDAIVSALGRAGVGPSVRPPSGTVVNVLIEIGADRRAWTVLPAEQVAGLGSRRVRAIPLHPALTIDGHVVASLTTPDTCITSFVKAFADR